MIKAIWIAGSIVTLALCEAAYYFVRYLLARREEGLRRRLQSVGVPDAGVQLLRRRRVADSAAVEELLGSSQVVRRVADLLEQTDLQWTVAQYFFYTGGFALVGFVFLGLLSRNTLAGLVFAVLFGAVPLIIVVNARAKRSRLISEQLSDALEMMARSLRAGHALPTSFQLVAREMMPPIAVEFGKAFEQQNLGLSFERAVVAMTERVPGNTDLSIFAVSVLVQRETGGNLIEILEKIAQTIRERDRFYGKLRALTAEGRLGGIILGGLPFVVAMLLTIINPTYMKELTQGMGRLILLGGMLSWLTGVFWMYRIAQVEY